MHPPPKLTSSHCIRGWHTLVYRCPSCMGQMYRPLPMQAHIQRSEDVMTPQESSGQVVTQCPATRLPWGGLTGSYNFYCGHLLDCPLKMGEDTR